MVKGSEIRNKEIPEVIYCVDFTDEKEFIDNIMIHMNGNSQKFKNIVLKTGGISYGF